MNENGFTEIMHAYLMLLGMMERAREALSGEIVPDNPDKKKEYEERCEETPKGIDPRPAERHARYLAALQALGFRPHGKGANEMAVEHPENVLDRIKDTYRLFKDVPLINFQDTDNRQDVAVFFEYMDKIQCAEEILSNSSKIRDYRKRNAKALEVLGLKPIMTNKKRNTELKNILFFIRYLDLVMINPSTITPPKDQDFNKRKKKAVQRLVDKDGKSLQAVIKQLKRGRRLIIERERKEGLDSEWLSKALPAFSRE